MKKPLNQIETPAYPDIKKGPPRFVWSRKHWTADEASLRDTEPFTQFYENAVLVQSRDYNKTQYGQSSHKDIVNAEFRPPLISPYEDNGPITRIPCTIHAIVPRINPATVADDGGTGSYHARNQRPSDIEAHLTDRLKGEATWRPTFYAPMDAPLDNSVLPDLVTTMPNISLQAGWEIPYNSGIEGVKPPLPLKDQIFVQPLQTTPQPSFTIDGQNKNIENFTLISTLPSHSVSSGVAPTYKSTIYNENVKLGHTSGFDTPFFSGQNSNVTIDGTVEYISDLDKTLPYYSANAGSQTSFTSPLEDLTPTLQRKTNPYSATSFSQTDFTQTSPNPEYHLQHKLPQVSATSGSNVNYTSHFEERNYDLKEKLNSVPINVINPEFGYFEDNGDIQTMDNKIRQNTPAISYYIPQEVPTFREKNEMTYNPHFQEKLQVGKSYGNVAQSGGFIPRFGIDVPRENFGSRGNAVKRMGYAKQTPKYRI